MPKKRRPAADENVAAFDVVRRLTDSDSPVVGHIQREPQPPTEKNPAAVALGRLGGLKGGKARARKLSQSERTEIARKGGSARWKNKKNGDH